MQIGMSTACFFGRIYNEDALKEIAKLKIKEVEIFFSAQMEYKKSFVRELKEICVGEGIEVCSIHALPTQFEPQLYSRHGRQFEEAYGIFENVLLAANELGAKKYVFHGPMGIKFAKKIPLNFPWLGERTGLLAKKAKEHNVRLCYENVHWCWYSFPGFAKKLVENCDSDNLFFTLDIKQAVQSGFSVGEYIKDMGDRLAHIHICDYKIDEKKGILPCLPFSGQFDWEEFIRELVRIKYNSTLMLEVYSNDYSSYADLKHNYDEVRQFFLQRWHS